eukprot:comp19411_c0_seq1/m.22487 comp19411_c0_seq1/g.22487  ORF comp19411_c0_seq1/g.22487 comp19411_c0_seq1/m.22487 type:complete len:1074 (-) comp19411_c0_seq1:497-3718(-)
MGFEVDAQEVRGLMEDSLGRDMAHFLHKNYGGVEGMAKRLHTDRKGGLSGDPSDLALRQKVFGENRLPKPSSASFLRLVWEAMQDLTLMILVVAGIVSLVLGLTIEEDKSTGWIEGTSILCAVAIVVLVTAINDYQKDKQFRALSDMGEDIKVTVVRNGREQQISVFDVVVGDILVLSQGDGVCADGLVLQSADLRVNESSLTGESDELKKNKDESPFVYAGTQVTQGCGRFLVCCVGPNSQLGIIHGLIAGGDSEKAPPRPSVNHNADDERTPLLSVTTDASPEKAEQNEREGGSVLQEKLETLSVQIGKGGMVMAALTVLVLVVRFCIETYTVRGWEKHDAETLLMYFITGVTVLVVAVPEGLPLAVTVSLAYSVRKMLQDNNLVRHLSACETMGNATTICTDKTGTLTTNRMRVVRGWIGGTMHDLQPMGSKPTVPTFKPAVQSLLGEGVAVNSSAYIEGTEHIGSKTECALLQLAVDMGIDYRQVRADHPALRLLPFSSDRKRMSTVIGRTRENGGYILHCKGAAELVLGQCTHQMGTEGEIAPLSDSDRHKLEEVIRSFAHEGLRTLCLAFKAMSAPSSGDWEGLASEDIECGLTCLAIVGIMDPLRPEVTDAVAQCQAAGIVVRMVTGDNIGTATAIATQCGILKQGQLVMEGPEFRKKILKPDGSIDPATFAAIYPDLRVLARSSPNDKYLLVSGLLAVDTDGDKQVVAVTGDGTNDAPALKRADVGFAMGIQGTQVAKDAADIIIMDDNFSSIVRAVMWGRNVYDSVSKFLQFQLTVNVVALILAFFGACILEESPLTSIQMLWLNLIMDTLASLALATDPPSTDLLQRKPYPRDKPIITRRMMRFVLGHSLYQCVAVFVLLFAGPKLFGFESALDRADKNQPTEHLTVVFNVFVLCQLFNEFNARKIYGEFNVIKGMLTNPLFMAIMFAEFVSQVVIVQYGGRVFSTVPLSPAMWGWCLLIGFGELVWNVILNILPRCVDAPLWALRKKAAKPPTKSARVLWLRSVRRIRNQLLVVHAFEQAAEERRRKIARDSLLKMRSKTTGLTRRTVPQDDAATLRRQQSF